MRRREFITLLGGAAAVWPLAARAQQPGERTRRIGFLLPISQSDPVTQEYLAALAQGLAPLGWWEGRNVQMDTRLARGRRPRIGARRNRALAMGRSNLVMPARSGNVKSWATAQECATFGECHHTSWRM